LQAGIGVPLAVVANIFVARALGVKEFGIVATLLTAYALATTVANMGINDATIQWGSLAHARGDRAALRALIRKCAGYHYLVEAPLLAIATFLLLHDSSLPLRVATAVAAGGSATIATSALAFVALSRSATTARVGLVNTVLIQIAVVGTALATKSGAATWAARVIIGSLAPVILWTRLPADLKRAVIVPMRPTHWPDGFASYALKAGVGILVAALVFSRSELFVLQAHDLAVAAGAFALAFGIAAQITAPVDSVLNPLIPAAASIVAAAPSRVAPALRRGLRFTALGSGLIAAFAVAPVSALVPTIYGNEFIGATNLFLALALVSCVQSLHHPVTAFIYAKRRVGTMLVINIVAFAIDIGVTVATVPDLGAWGAVIGNATGQILSLGPAVYVVGRDLGVPLRSLIAPMRGFAFGAAAAVLGWLVASVVAPDTVPDVAKAALGFATGAGAFATLARAARTPLLTTDDQRLIAEVLPRRFEARVSRAIQMLRLVPRHREA
jgi:O-antigen/teichoic acid export membrane protein